MKKFKRINILIEEDQYRRIQAQKINLSGLVRTLITDHFSQSRVVLAVSPQTRAFYDKALSNFGGSDAELERHFLRALDSLLDEKLGEIEKLREDLKRG